MKPAVLFPALLWIAEQAMAQPCDPATAPTGLSAAYTPGTGALLQWTAVPSSVGVQIQATTPSGASVSRRLIGPGLDQYLVPDALLAPGTYTWRVQAACSATPPYAVTPISAPQTFTVGGGGACPASVTDVDGNAYGTVSIGAQCWLAENLRTEHYRNGDALPSGLTDDAWQSTSSGAFEVYDNDPLNKDRYGLLYNWYAVDDARGLCPVGWHVPDNTDWTALTDHLGGVAAAGFALKATAADDPAWNGTNSSGFGAVPGGVRSPSFGFFLYLDFYGFWWSASEYSSTLAHSRSMLTDGVVSENFYSKRFGYSVRCVQD